MSNLELFERLEEWIAEQNVNKHLPELPDDTMIVKIMSYRAIDITPKMSAEERIFYQKMKRLYAIPLPKSEQEKYSAIEDALIAGKPIDDLI